MKNFFDWKEYQYRIALGLLCVALFIFFVFKSFINSRIDADKKHVSTQTILSSKIAFIERYSSEAKIILANGEIMYFSRARNLAYKQVDISVFLNIGDSVSKSFENDTVKVYRRDSVYTFVLLKSVVIKPYSFPAMSPVSGTLR